MKPIPTINLYVKSQFPGMRESGDVINDTAYTIAEYDDHDYRLKPIAELLKNIVTDHFVLYDYKGSIRTNNQEVINILNAKYNGQVETEDNDLLIVDDVLLDISPIEVVNKRLKVKNPGDVSIQNANPSFGIKGIAKILSRIITKIPTNDGMFIGIFGKWGRGKTYFIDEIIRVLSIRNNNRSKFIKFSAWKYQNTKESWAYLYETMLSSYLNDSNKKGIIFTLEKQIKIIKINLNKHKWSKIISFIILVLLSVYFTFFIGAISVIKTTISILGFSISLKLYLLYLRHKNTALGLVRKYTSKASYSEYLGLQAQIEEDISVLLKTWIKNDNDNKIYLIVDDIDRCEMSKIVNIIDGLRIILDNKIIHDRLVIITAIDEEILRQAIYSKYNDFEIGKTKDQMFQDYLEKIFIIGLKLDNLNSIEKEEFMKNLLEYNPNNNNFDDIQIKNERIKTTNQYKAQSNIFYIDNSENDIIDDIPDDEKNQLLKSIHLLDNATPRKMRIFLYKYEIFKKILIQKLRENNIDLNSIIINDEEHIVNIVLHISNFKSIYDFDFKVMNNIIKDEIINTARLFSVL